jgi:8-oxo-dGTP pyrophosphatase MutT (NUDIX family)
LLYRYIKETCVIVAPVSKKQYRYIQAILHGSKHGTSSRGDRMPASVAAKYSGKPDKSAPESKGKEHKGGRWDEKKKKKKLNKAEEIKPFEITPSKKAAGCIVLSSEGRILLGKRADNGLWTNPGGHVEENEAFQDAALRELKEEAGLIGEKVEHLIEGHYHGYDGQTFLVSGYSGQLSGNGELLGLQWFFPHEIPWKDLTPYAFDGIRKLMKDKLSKTNSLPWLLAEEVLNKNILRGGNAPSNTVFEVTHGDALKLVGNSTFKWLKKQVADMTDESFKEIPLAEHTIHIRKHVNDVYSGRIVDGHKQIHQFTNRSLPAVCAEIMSVFEWYLPEDESIVDDVADEHLHDGLSSLSEDYRKNNIGNIYQEMENIRVQIRHGNAVDLQQVEQKIMKLFDRLEETLISVVDKHNQLNTSAGKEIDELESKLRELQYKIDELDKKPVTVQAYTPNIGEQSKIHNQYYPYLSKPQIKISPDGSVSISFGQDWMATERENFLHDLKAKAIKKSK